MSIFLNLQEPRQLPRIHPEHRAAHACMFVWALSSVRPIAFAQSFVGVESAARTPATQHRWDGDIRGADGTRAAEPDVFDNVGRLRLRTPPRTRAWCSSPFDQGACCNVDRQSVVNRLGSE